jgi:DNA-binding SARP family transcriptional activator
VAAARHGADLPSAQGRLSAGLAYLLAGEINEARAALIAAAGSEDASPELAAGALLAGAVAAALAGDPAAKAETDLASRRAEGLRLPWLGRMCQAVLALSDRPDGRSEAAAVRLSCASQGDVWGACLAGLLEGLGELRAGGTRAGCLDEAAARFAELGANVLEAWCLCVRAAILANGDDASAHAAAEIAERSARMASLQAPWALAYLALARTDTQHGPEFERWARTVALKCGLALPQPPAPDNHSAGAPRAPSFTVRCFGGFRIERGSDLVEFGAVKPRARKLLRLLALHMGRPLHREVLIESLWPGTEPDVGARSLHVALSSLRQLLQAAPCSDVLRITREGEDYRLIAAAGTNVDVVDFAAHLDRGRRSRSAGDIEQAIDALTQALALHKGDLLPEDGPDEWVVRDRERFRGAAVEAARTLGGLLLAEGDPAAACRACELGLDIDRNRDDLWRTLQLAHQTAGNHAAAKGARRRYERVLSDLGVDPEGVTVQML